MKTLSETFKGKVAAITLAGSTLLASFAGPAFGNGGGVCPADPAPGKHYTEQNAIEITMQSKGTGFLVNDNEDDLWIATGLVNAMRGKGVPAVLITAQSGVIPEGHIKSFGMGLPLKQGPIETQIELIGAYTKKFYEAAVKGGVVARVDPNYCAGTEQVAALTH